MKHIWHNLLQPRVVGVLALLIALLSILPTLAAPTAQPGSKHVYLPLVNRGVAGKPATPPPAQPTPVPPVPPTPTPVPPTPSGFFALRDYLTYNAATAVDAHGGIHLAFSVSDEKHEDKPSGLPALYTYCPGPTSACADPAKWSALVNLTERVNQVQIALTADGRPRLLVRRSRTDQNWDDYVYFACEQQCTNAQSWTGLLVAQPAGVEVQGSYLPQHAFALDSQGRPRFVYANGWGNGQPNAIHYAYCDAADCTVPGSWNKGTIMSGPANKTLGSDYASLAFDGDKPRVVLRTLLSGLPDAVYYFACESDCDQELSWSKAPLTHPENKMWANWDLALDANGHPRVALYEPAPIDITVGGKLFYAACDANNCANPAAWQLTPVASGEGKNVDLALDAQGRTHMVYDAGQRGTIGEVWCDTSCTTSTQWKRRILETSAQLQQEFPVPSPLTCDQQERAWFDAIPSAAFDQAGRLVVAYDIVNYATCYTRDPNKPNDPPTSEVKRLWWAVRWENFGRG